MNHEAAVRAVCEAVSDDGELISERITQEETIYVGRNGKAIKRFALAADPSTTYIFKPLTNPQTIGREPWAHRHLLPLLPVRAPGVVAFAGHDDPDRYWIVCEDEGSLRHELGENELVAAARLVASWHRLPLELVPAEYVGDKPAYAAIRAELRDRYSELASSVAAAPDPLPPQLAEALHAAVFAASDPAYVDVPVVSHGDLHRGNVAAAPAAEQLLVLDWEHIHRNAAYWDLYHLLDITHPTFRRDITPRVREAALAAYAEERRRLGWDGDLRKFTIGYAAFAALYSAWMLLLIEADRRKSLWSPAELSAAREETMRSLRECLAFFV